MVCPQQVGPPLFAVFLETSWDDEEPHRPGGHVVLVASDGALVRYYAGANLLDGVIGDLNADGLVDCADVINHGLGDGLEARVLYVVPVTEAQRPRLRVAFSPGRTTAPWVWRAVDDPEGPALQIELGPPDPRTGELAEVHARWRWSSEEREWIGPEGGLDQPFLRLPPEGKDELRAFAASHAR